MRRGQRCSEQIFLHTPEFGRRAGETRRIDHGMIAALFDIVKAASNVAAGVTRCACCPVTQTGPRQEKVWLQILHGTARRSSPCAWLFVVRSGPARRRDVYPAHTERSNALAARMREGVHRQKLDAVLRPSKWRRP
jgi:hypothetical protein